MKKAAALLLISLAAASTVLAQDFSKVEVTALRINDTTYMLTGSGGNIVYYRVD